MSVPDHLHRYSTRKAIDSLAARFDLPSDSSMQDWELEVADPDRIDEFLDAYSRGGLDDDERFTLMETIIQSFEELPHHPESDSRWESVLSMISEHISLHIPTLWNWSALETEDLEEAWRVTPSLRHLLFTQTQYRDAEQAVASALSFRSESTQTTSPKIPACPGEPPQPDSPR